MRPIFVVLHNVSIPFTALEMAEKMATAFDQEIKLLLFEEHFLDESISKFSHIVVKKEHLATFAEENDAAMILFEIPQKTSNRTIQNLLHCSRNLRMPYLFVKQGQRTNFSSILVPITFLEEDKEKALFSSAFGRFFQSKITLLTANDYGSKAKRNTDAIKTLLNSFSLIYNELTAKKDSFGVEKEAIKKATTENHDLVILSASREYGLDDWLFGPKEQRLIKKSEVALMLINPRGDLYALCN
ncbi:MAG: universal stress protein [Paludibacteraceae bacterium]|jgi:hypothetical protein|nr:universal stress protein [Paludibacteraceae bacterium]